MRITAGTMRGRIVPVSSIDGLRPTPSKVRQALFNILGNIENWQVADLFSGSGIMAMEALSRGAQSAVSIEKHATLARDLKRLRQQFDLNQWEIISGQLPQTLASLQQRSFDLVFADPPYQQGFASLIPAWLDQQQIDCHQLVIEESSRIEPQWPEGWTHNQSRRYGDTTLHFLTKENP